MRLFVAAALFAVTTLPAAAQSYYPSPDDEVSAESSGLTIASASDGASHPLPFGTGFQDTMHMLVLIFGPEVSVAFPQECGAGPLVSATIPGQINLIFQDDRFAGWMLSNDAGLSTSTGLGVGSPTDAVGPVAFVDYGMGQEFDAGGIFGLLTEEGRAVEAIWAGTSCIFR